MGGFRVQGSFRKGFWGRRSSVPIEDGGGVVGGVRVQFIQGLLSTGFRGVEGVSPKL